MTKEVSQTLDALENVDGVGERFCRLDTDSNSSSSVAGAAVDSCTAGQLQLHPAGASCTPSGMAGGSSSSSSGGSVSCKLCLSSSGQLWHCSTQHIVSAPR